MRVPSYEGKFFSIPVRSPSPNSAVGEFNPDDFEFIHRPVVPERQSMAVDDLHLHDAIRFVPLSVIAGLEVLVLKGFNLANDALALGASERCHILINLNSDRDA